MTDEFSFCTQVYKLVNEKSTLAKVESICRAIIRWCSFGRSSLKHRAHSLVTETRRNVSDAQNRIAVRFLSAAENPVSFKSVIHRAAMHQTRLHRLLCGTRKTLRTELDRPLEYFIASVSCPHILPTKQRRNMRCTGKSDKTTFNIMLNQCKCWVTWYIIQLWSIKPRLQLHQGNMLPGNMLPWCKRGFSRLIMLLLLYGRFPSQLTPSWSVLCQRL